MSTNIKIIVCKYALKRVKNMILLNNKCKLSKNNMIVYEIFNINPFKTFDVNELLESINKDKHIMSKRTVFRAVKNLIAIGEIYCCNIIKGTRRFKLLKNDYYVMICENCGSKEFGKIKDFDTIEDILGIKNDFYIKKMSIEIIGICECCSKENNNMYKLKS